MAQSPNAPPEVHGQQIGSFDLGHLTAEALDVQDLQVQRQGIEGQREDARKAIAFIIIVGTFAFIIRAAFITVWTRGRATSIDDITKLFQVLIGPVAGIVGAVTGVYFGASQAQRSGQTGSQ